MDQVLQHALKAQPQPIEWEEKAPLPATPAFGRTRSEKASSLINDGLPAAFRGARADPRPLSVER
jgi:hypothetical protein